MIEERIGYAVAIRRKDGSLFLTTPGTGFAPSVYFTHREAKLMAAEYREDKLDAHPVKVQHREPVILGPARLLASDQKDGNQ